MSGGWEALRPYEQMTTDPDRCYAEATSRNRARVEAEMRGRRARGLSPLLIQPRDPRTPPLSSDVAHLARLAARWLLRRLRR